MYAYGIGMYILYILVTLNYQHYRYSFSNATKKQE